MTGGDLIGESLIRDVAQDGGWDAEARVAAITARSTRLSPHS